jgi:hypothetical protein
MVRPSGDQVWQFDGLVSIAGVREIIADESRYVGAIGVHHENAAFRTAGRGKEHDPLAIGDHDGHIPRPSTRSLHPLASRFGVFHGFLRRA